MIAVSGLVEMKICIVHYSGIMSVSKSKTPSQCSVSDYYAMNITTYSSSQYLPCHHDPPHRPIYQLGMPVLRSMV